MKAEDFEKFGQMLVAVADLYGKSMGEMAISMYFNALKEFDLPAVREAFNRYVKNPDTGQFMPKPADLIRMISGTSADSAMAAWAKVDKSVRSVGQYSSVAFDDPIIHRVIADMGGWAMLGTKTDDEWPFVARDFQAAYKGYAHRGEKPEYEPVLLGIADSYNIPKGYEHGEVTLIGNKQDAQLVIENGVAENKKRNTFSMVNFEDVKLKMIG